MTPEIPQLRLPRAVLFDNDGVLVASEPLHAEAWSVLFGELGLEVEPRLIQSLAGRTGPQILKIIFGMFRPEWNEREYDAEALALRKNDYYQAHLVSTLKPYPGVVELLRWLKAQGIATAVVSNAKDRELNAAVKQAGLETYLDVKISRDDVARPKPDPLPYLTACALLGVEPDQTWVVEDSPPGLSAGLLAGAMGIGVLSTFTSDVLIAPVTDRPDLKTAWIAQDIAQIHARLRELAKN